MNHRPSGGLGIEIRPIEISVSGPTIQQRSRHRCEPRSDARDLRPRHAQPERAKLRRWTRHLGTGSDTQTILVRYDGDGSLDGTLGTGGIGVNAGPDTDGWSGIAVQPDECLSVPSAPGTALRTSCFSFAGLILQGEVSEERMADVLRPLEGAGPDRGHRSTSAEDRREVAHA